MDSSSVNSANLIEQNDALSLKVRELEMAVKSSNEQTKKLEEKLETKEYVPHAPCPGDLTLVLYILQEEDQKARHFRITSQSNGQHDET